MTEQLVAEIQNGHEDLCGELWKRIRQRVVWYANRFSGAYNLARYGLDREDLIQCGYVAMINAVKGYHPGAASFGTYLNHHLKACFYAAIGRTEKQFQDPINRCRSLDVPVNTEDPDGPVLIDTIPDDRDRIQDVEDAVFNEQLHDALERVLDKLDPDEAHALRSSFYDGMTTKEAAEEMGVPVERVRQLRQSGLRNAQKHRHALEQYVDYHTPFFLSVGVSTFTRTHESAVEKLTLMREHIARQAPFDIYDA